MAFSFTQRLREGYRQLLCSLPPEERGRVVCLRAAMAGARTKQERADRFFELVVAYRSGSRQIWGPVLLDTLAPDLLLRRRRLRLEEPVACDDDIEQQLLLEVLVAAAQMQLPASCLYLRNRVVARANQAVARGLRRERRRQARQESLEFLLDRDEAMSEWERWKSMLPPT